MHQLIEKAMWHWLNSQREQRRKALADADELMRLFDERTYDEARDRARATSADIGIQPPRRNAHWDRVRHEIGHRTGHSPLDIAARYLINERVRPSPLILPPR